MFSFPRLSLLLLPLALLPAACLGDAESSNTGDDTGDGDGDVSTGGDGDGEPSICSPGATRICVGPGACEGGQFCQDGAWSMCECGDSMEGTGGASPPIVVSPAGGTTGIGGSPTITGGTTGVGGSPGTGGRIPSGTDSVFVAGGRGTSNDGSWDGYTFAAAGDNSTIMPTEFTGSNLCVSGELAPSYEEWALVGWNIAQDIDPETFAPGEVNAISPGGSGVSVTVQNNGGSGLRVQIQADDMGLESWCAPAPATGSGTIPWSDFTKECWAPGGEAYDGTTPLAQIAIQTYAGSETMPTSFDYCVIDIQPAP